MSFLQVKNIHHTILLSIKLVGNIKKFRVFKEIELTGIRLSELSKMISTYAETTLGPEPS